VEHARNVAGIVGADHEQTAPDASALVISQLACSLRGTQQTAFVLPGTFAHEAYGKDSSTEHYLCRFGVNDRYREQLFGGDLKIAGQDAEGNVRIVELRSHPFFLATLFVPQLSSEAGHPHPLILAFVRAAEAFHGSR
jgi:CTP synthase (UTP-ammonia lyase)